MIIPRYPGGKSVIGRKVREFLPFPLPSIYVEPFVGGGSMLMQVISENRFSEVWINDKDRGVASVYRAVQNFSEELCRAIRQCTPSVELWYECKELDGQGSVVEQAFRKIFLHACSHGGIGKLAGGPQGGRQQESEYKIDCRWHVSKMERVIRRASRLSENWHVFNSDFADLPINSSCFVYCDPPYFEQGKSLYQHAFTERDHVRLENWLAGANDALISYDNCKFIDDLYSRWERKSFPMGSGNNPRCDKEELVIWKGC